MISAIEFRHVFACSIEECFNTVTSAVACPSWDPGMRAPEPCIPVGWTLVGGKLICPIHGIRVVVSTSEETSGKSSLTEDVYVLRGVKFEHSSRRVTSRQ